MYKNAFVFEKYVCYWSHISFKKSKVTFFKIVDNYNLDNFADLTTFFILLVTIKKSLTSHHVALGELHLYPEGF